MEIVLAVLGLALAAWQYIRAERAQDRAEHAQAKLHAEVAAIPSRVAAQVEHVLQPQRRGAEEFQPNVLRHVDIDGDGENEILLEYLAPATGVLLKVFDWKENQLVEIGELFSQQPGFQYSDVDADGKTEIVAFTMLPDAEVVSLSPRSKLVFKWDGQEFREITGFRWEGTPPRSITR